MRCTSHLVSEGVQASDSASVLLPCSEVAHPCTRVSLAVAPLLVRPPPEKTARCSSDRCIRTPPVLKPSPVTSVLPPNRVESCVQLSSGCRPRFSLNGYSRKRKRELGQRVDPFVRSRSSVFPGESPLFGGATVCSKPRSVRRAPPRIQAEACSTVCSGTSSSM